MIQLIGPGGAGKTTVGMALAERLGAPFVDLDREFTARAGDISAYMVAHGYDAYSALNVEVYLDIVTSTKGREVIALSSGFITYRNEVHPSYRGMRQEIINSPSTVVLLPSFDYETCVAETVRRQLRRPFRRSPGREEQVIRERFSIYCNLPAKKFETSMPVDWVVDSLAAYALNNSLQRT